MLKKLFTLAILPLLIYGCSSSKYTESEESRLQEKLASELKNKAQEHFIRGSIADMNQEYAAAILEYQDALNYDPQAGIYYALAKDYLALNKLSLALKNSQKSVELDPKNLDYLHLLGKVYLSSKLTDSAIQTYQKIVELDTTNMEALFTLGYLYEQENPLQALETYKKIISIAGPEWSALVRMADLYDRMGNIDEAVKTIEDLAALDPSNINLQRLLLETYIKGEKTEKALKFAEELLITYPDDPGILELQAQAFIMKDDWNSAAKVYNSLFKNPNLPYAAKYRVALAYYTQSFRDSSITDVSQNLFETLDRDTTDWQIKFYLGDIAMRKGADSVAAGYYNQVIDLAGWNPEPWMRLGGLYFDNREYRKAIEVLSKGIEHFPDDFTINLILGISHSQVEEYKESEPYLKKAVRLNQNDVVALSSYAFTLNQLDSTDLAIQYINKSLKIDSANAELWGMLGMIYNDQKKFDECDKAYSKAYSLDPSNPLINNNYAYSLAERRVQLDKALEMASLAVEKEPGNSSYLDTKGWVHFQMGEFDKAKELIEKSYKMDEDNPEVVEHLADVLFKIGDKEKAKELWRKAMELGSDNEQLKTKIEKGEL